MLERMQDWSSWDMEMFSTRLRQMALKNRRAERKMQQQSMMKKWGMMMDKYFDKLPMEDQENFMRDAKQMSMKDNGDW